jgi:hypothetical protein
LFATTHSDRPDRAGASSHNQKMDAVRAGGRLMAAVLAMSLVTLFGVSAVAAAQSSSSEAALVLPAPQ